MGSEPPRRRWSRLIRPTPRAEVDDELAFHIEERVREYVARGMEPEAARAAAMERLGDLEPVRAECTDLLAAERRAEAQREWLKVSWLDFKLGFRMLVKYPVLTIVGGLAMAFAIWVGAGTFEFVRQVVSPALPLDAGHRVVGVLMVDARRSAVERRTASDFVRWRDEVRALDDFGAFRTLDRNLVTGDGVGEPVEVAEITASGFDVARVPPLLGRTLVAADEAPGAPPVVVLGHDVWTERFGADPEIVGRPIRLGISEPTVVGVMPEGFEFPVAQSLWMPLSRGALEHDPREGPGLFMFGRLAPGVSLAAAQAELTALGQRAAADLPETHEHLRPKVLPYAKSILYMPGAFSLALMSINVFVILLLVLICSNVALLMFARAATRESEILVRSALGASRARIVAQLFTEALVLGGIAAALGLAGAGYGLRWLFSAVLTEVSGQRLPFWFTETLSPATVGYTLLLTLLAATIAGVVPALKVTGRQVEARLREASAGGGGLRFGGVWTAVIIAQVALTVAVPAFTLLLRDEALGVRDLEVGFPAEEYLSVRLEMDRAEGGPSPGGWVDELSGMSSAGDTSSLSAFEERYRRGVSELERRLETRPGVSAVTFGERLPRMYHPHRLIEVDEGGAAPKHPQWPSYRVSSVEVAPDYFDVLQVPIRAGRGFHSGDVAADARAVVVNESFVELVLGGRNPIGRHIQYVFFEDEGARDPENEPWYQIVGVVRDLGLSAGDFDPKRAGIYHPVAPGRAYPTHMAVHVTGRPQEFARELRTLAATIDPALRLYNVMPLDRLDESELRFYSFWLSILALISGGAITLSLAGIYAAMSFAVSRRTREIGIRVALGAHRRRIVASIFRRPLIQVGLGLAFGGLLVLALAWLGEGDRLTPGVVAGVAVYMVIMAAICMLACIVPVRRALLVEPTEALRADG